MGNSKSLINNNILYMIDGDLDDTSGFFKKLFKSENSAFSKPNLLCNMVDEIPEDVHIKIILTTHGGALCYCDKILRKLLKHKGGYSVYIRNECYSAGAIIALGADEIIMNDDSYLGKIDPVMVAENDSKQCIIYSSVDEKLIDSHIYYEVENSKNILNYELEILNLIFDKKKVNSTSILENMIYSKLPHEKLFDINECKDKLGLNIRNPRDDEKIYFDKKIKVFNYKRIN